MSELQQEKPRHPGGRPTLYSLELAEQVCELIAQGYSMREVEQVEGMPTKETLRRWLWKHDEFCAHYLRAKRAVALGDADELREIADNGTNDWMERRHRETGEVTGYQLNGEAVARSKLRVDTRLAIAERLLPKVFGKLSQVELGGELRHKTVVLNLPAGTVPREALEATAEPVEREEPRLIGQTSVRVPKRSEGD